MFNRYKNLKIMINLENRKKKNRKNLQKDLSKVLKRNKQKVLKNHKNKNRNRSKNKKYLKTQLFINKQAKNKT